MATPFTRAKAKDAVDGLDNLTAYFGPDTRQEILDYVTSTFGDIEKVMARALETGDDPVEAYKGFVQKFGEYWSTEPDQAGF